MAGWCQQAQGNARPDSDIDLLVEFEPGLEPGFLGLAEIEAELAKYPNAEVVWAQDEPANQGPWPFIGLNLPTALDRKIRLVSRPASASTAAGSMKRHAAEQDTLIKQAFARK